MTLMADELTPNPFDPDSIRQALNAIRGCQTPEGPCSRSRRSSTSSSPRSSARWRRATSIGGSASVAITDGGQVSVSGVDPDGGGVSVIVSERLGERR